MSAKPDLWMPLYFGAYLTDTMHLKTEQHGAYFLLLMACWKRGGELPDDDEQLGAITKMTPAKWRKTRAIIAPFWQIGKGVWTQKRLTHELEAARERSATAKENGSKGGRPRKADDNPEETQQEPGGLPERNPGESSVPLPRPSQTSRPGPRPGSEPQAAAPTRAGEIVVLLRRLAAQREKIVRIASIEKKVTDWAEKGITDAQLTAAFDLAVQDRENKHEASAITPGFIDVFLGKLLTQGSNGSRVSAAPALDWWKTPDGIFAKAEAEHVEVAMRDNGETLVRDDRTTLARLCVKLGPGSWQDERNGTLMRTVEEIRRQQSVGTES